MMRDQSILAVAFGVCCALAQSGPAFAQSAPIHVWTGPYVGFNAGLAIGDYKFSAVENEALKAGEEQEAVRNSARYSASGGLFGVQAGYLHQFSNRVVIGAETDFQWSSYRYAGREREVSSETNTPESEIGKLETTYFGTVRARVGYAFGPVLPYVTGGAAYGRTATTFSEGEAEEGQPGTVKSGKTKWGYALGAGVEYAIAPAWRLKAEYLHVDLGSYSATGLESVRFDLPTRFNLFRIGLNYAFGDRQAPAPASAFYDEAALSGDKPRFGGFSLGVTAGLGAGEANVEALAVEEANTTRITRSMNARGGLFGAEIGYHHAFSNNLVIGAVADHQFSSYGAQAKVSEQSAQESESEEFRATITQFGTLRARAGYAFGAWMPYVTGGFAWGRAELRDVIDPPEEGEAPFRANRNLTGYALGAGFEYALTQSVALKAEYLYVDLGSVTARTADGGSIKAPVNMNVGRVGLTYRF